MSFKDSLPRLAIAIRHGRSVPTLPLGISDFFFQDDKYNIKTLEKWTQPKRPVPAHLLKSAHQNLRTYILMHAVHTAGQIHSRNTSNTYLHLRDDDWFILFVGISEYLSKREFGLENTH